MSPGVPAQREAAPGRKPSRHAFIAADRNGMRCSALLVEVRQVSWSKMPANEKSDLTVQFAPHSPTTIAKQQRPIKN